MTAPEDLVDAGGSGDPVGLPAAAQGVSIVRGLRAAQEPPPGEPLADYVVRRDGSYEALSDRAKGWEQRSAVPADALVLPYADGTGGHSGGDTSRERAEREADDGTLHRRQRETVESLRGRHSAGMTWRELALARGWHHGQASGVLSGLHLAGLVARLTERRDRCSVYVLPEFVGERETAAHGRKPRPGAGADAAVVDAATRLRQEWRDGNGEGGALFVTVRASDLLAVCDAVAPEREPS